MSILCLPALSSARLLAELVPVVIVDTGSCSVVYSLGVLFAHAENVAESECVVTEAVIYLTVSPLVVLVSVSAVLENSVAGKLCEPCSVAGVTETAPVCEVRKSVLGNSSLKGLEVGIACIHPVADMLVDVLYPLLLACELCIEQSRSLSGIVPCKTPCVLPVL